jgi:serine phosphatase RsbU (regulator of sigma subunit)/Tfp pilus assembly protein PilF
MKINLFILFVVLVCLFKAGAQNNSAIAGDTASMRKLLMRSREIRGSKPDSALTLAFQCFDASSVRGFEKLKAESALIISGINLSKSNLVQAEKFARLAVSLYRLAGDSAGVASSFNALGKKELFNARYPSSLSAFLYALKLYEAKGDLKNSGYTNVNIGRVFLREENFAEAMKYYEQAMKLFDQAGETRGQHIAYSSLGYIYERQKDFKNALDFNFKCLKLYTRDGDKNGIAGICASIGNLKAEDGNFDEAIGYSDRAVNIYRELGDKEGLAAALNGQGNVFMKKNDFIGAEKAFREALASSRETNNKEEIKNSLLNLAEVYAKTGDYKKAYTFHVHYTNSKDSLLTDISRKEVSEIQTRFETEKKEKEIELLLKEKELDNEKLANRNTAILFTVVAVALLAFSLLMLFNRYKLKNRTNRKLEEKNVIIEKKNKDITDSISYAKRIQEAFLPSLREMQSVFSDFFILYQPKDIVSGDFYWFCKSRGSIYIAVADCTGHGVPGALMSMIGHDELNHIVIEKACSEPAEILSALNRNVKLALKQEEQESESRDGMDIAICKLEPVNENFQLTFAGAQRPLLIFRPTGITELRSDKVSIGGFTESSHNFSQQQQILNKGDLIYLFSDGFADQFGGERGKKFKYARLLSLLKENHHLPLADQQKLLSFALKNWMGNLEQVDDITVAGIRL